MWVCRSSKSWPQSFFQNFRILSKLIWMRNGRFWHRNRAVSSWQIHEPGMRVRELVAMTKIQKLSQVTTITIWSIMLTIKILIFRENNLINKHLPFNCSVIFPIVTKTLQNSQTICKQAKNICEHIFRSVNPRKCVLLIHMYVST